MTTNEERREVARRLRALRSGWSSGECYYTIIHELELPDTSREDGGAALYARLADLIDPGTTSDTTTDTTNSPELTTKCDRDALLALADEMKRMPQCELCPAEIVDCSEYPDGCPDSLLDYYARRIREALGVES